MGSPGTISTGEGAVQSLPSPVVCHLLLPDRLVRAIVARAGVQGGEWGAVEGVGRFVCLQVRFEGGSGSFGDHGGFCPLVVAPDHVLDGVVGVLVGLRIGDAWS